MVHLVLGSETATPGNTHTAEYTAVVGNKNMLLWSTPVNMNTMQYCKYELETCLTGVTGDSPLINHSFADTFLHRCWLRLLSRHYSWRVSCHSTPGENKVRYVVLWLFQSSTCNSTSLNEDTFVVTRIFRQVKGDAICWKIWVHSLVVCL